MADARDDGGGDAYLEKRGASVKGVLAEAGEAGRKAEGGYRSTVTESAVADCRESGGEVQLGQGAAVLEGTAADRGHARREGDLAQGTTSREGADADGCEACRQGQLHEGSGVDECARREDGRARETEQVRTGRQSVAHQARAWHQAALLNCMQSATQLILRRREAQRASSCEGREATRIEAPRHEHEHLNRQRDERLCNERLSRRDERAMRSRHTQF
mmetsp:Transcript_33646/g.85573  ORF Transcript_33646/g.85573 Transcript_33646/m.85573 type:complete len:218 (+) Transcript_33646:246-899(+)|eukprot:CAMPEP_0118823204 /NCGR_PEP_ID=MMETSP1162-20130426/9731_1 /TAXON_ID=33656 /ORGANISM="Phaeocystis Sp, Strain CCMP2710" /LENGTH=217 /DNA_ID=CAMNT_0006753803 /DNA_START=165 /DNA_END=818 /DNA_ORIENTATION=+